MPNTLNKFLIVILVGVAAGCSNGEGQKSTAATSAPASTTATPSNKFIAADVAKLKWIEGTWRGMDGENPFYERYRIERAAMIVEGLKEDGSPDGEPGRFELKNGEFGKTEGDRRSVASEISDTHIQFVPAPGSKGNNFRFEHQSDGTWIALLEWPAAADKPARRKMYKMEPWQPKK